MEKMNLTFEELSVLNERKEEVKRGHIEYIDAHPELKTLLSSFMCAVLMEKPDDVVSFAKDHFSALKPMKIMAEPLVISGPSGVGKGTLINKLLEKYPNLFGFSVSHTTRGPRKGEEDGVAYHFTTLERVEDETEKGLFLEHANVHGNIYGTSKQAVFKVQNQGKICVLDIDIQGVQQVKASSMPAKFLFISPPTMAELESRLRGRGTETEEKIILRIKNAKGELDYATEGHFDKILVNSNIDDAFTELVETIREWYPQLHF